MMRSQTLTSRIATAFPEETDDETALSPKEYLDIVRTNWRSAEDNLRRATLGLLLAAVLFELVSKAGVAEFDLGPVKVTDLTIIRKGLPAVFAFLTLEWIALGVLINRLGSVHDALISHAFPRLFEQDLELPLAPTVMSLAGESRIVGEYGTPHKVMRMLTVLKTDAFLVLLFSSQVYFHCRQFSTFGFTDIFVWAALSLCLLFSVQALVLLGRFRSDPSWAP